MERTTGMRLTAWSPQLYLVLGGKLYAGGAFTVAGGKAVSQVARFDPGTGSWSALPGPIDADVLALAPVYDRYLAVGGKFGQVTTAEGTVRTGGTTACCGAHHEDRPEQDVVIKNVTLTERKK